MTSSHCSASAEAPSTLWQCRVRKINHQRQSKQRLGRQPNPGPTVPPPHPSSFTTSHARRSCQPLALRTQRTTRGTVAALSVCLESCERIPLNLEPRSVAISWPNFLSIFCTFGNSEALSDSRVSHRIRKEQPNISTLCSFTTCSITPSVPATRYSQITSASRSRFK